MVIKSSVVAVVAVLAFRVPGGHDLLSVHHQGQHRVGLPEVVVVHGVAEVVQAPDHGGEDARGGVVPTADVGEDSLILQRHVLLDRTSCASQSGGESHLCHDCRRSVRQRFQLLVLSLMAATSLSKAQVSG